MYIFNAQNKRENYLSSLATRYPDSVFYQKYLQLDSKLYEKQRMSEDILVTNDVRRDIFDTAISFIFSVFFNKKYLKTKHQFTNFYFQLFIFYI